VCAVSNEGLVNMKTISSLTVLTAAILLLQGLISGVARGEDGVAVAIVYDTSGSMHDPVRDISGKSVPKYVIANRALVAIAQQLERYATNSAGGAPRRIDAGLFVFAGDNAREAVKFGPLDRDALERFARTFSSPTGNTPLGNSVKKASEAVLKSPLPRKHVLLITDGMNTSGPAPDVVLGKMREHSKEQFDQVSVHFVAFDVDAQLFAGVKKLGATVVGAADEKQLNSQLEFIMQRKILLEEEEPKR
jgi:hypothetical protein